MTILDVIIPYPDFIMGEMIDPEQFDLNNEYTIHKINEILTLVNRITDSVAAGGSGADLISLTPIAPFASNKLQTFLQEVVTKLRSTTDGNSGADFVASTAIAGVTGTTVQAQLKSLKTLLDAIKITADANKTSATALKTDYDTHKANRVNPHGVTATQTGAYSKTESDTTLNTHKASTDHDARYYTKPQLDGGQMDSRYYTKSQLDGKVRGGDTVIRYDVFDILTSNNGDGTFTYVDDKGIHRTGTITPEGHQRFTLFNGFYNMGENRIEALINDTLHRSVASGGLIEDTPTTIILSQPEGNGAEVAFKYFERVGLTGEHALSHADGGSDEIRGLIFVSATAPKTTFSGKLWGKVL